MAKPTFVSLYAGAGGLDLGFSQAGFQCLWANDIDADAVATHNANLEGDAVCADISELGFDHLIEMKPDWVIGGPPCQGFSVAGHMRPDDPRSVHVQVFMDAVEAVSPRGFVMENVAALAENVRWQHTIRSLIARAERLGYFVDLWILNASEHGVPQARRRMFLMGSRDSAPVRPIEVPEGQRTTVRDALSSLPAYGSVGNDSTCRAIVTPARNPVLRKSPYAGMLFNGKGRTLDLNSPAPTLTASMGGNRTPVVDQDLITGKANSNWIEWYHRRLWYGGDPVSKIPKRMRRLTVEETAAIQTFRVGMKFVGSQSSQFRQIGNAVPPLLAEKVANSAAAAQGVRLHGLRVA